MSEGDFQDKSREGFSVSPSQHYAESYDSDNPRESMSDECNPRENAEQNANEREYHDSESSEAEISRRKPISRPLISGRSSVPYDSVSPRGGSSFSRISPGYSKNRQPSQFGSGLGMDEELGIRSEEDSSSEVPTDEYVSDNRDDFDRPVRGYGSDFSRENRGYIPSGRRPFRRQEDGVWSRGGNSGNTGNEGDENADGIVNAGSDGINRDYRGDYRDENRGENRGEYRNDYRGGERPGRRPYGGYRNSYGGGHSGGYGNNGARTGYRNNGNYREGYGNNGGEWRGPDGGMNSGYAGRNGYGGRPRRRNTDGYSTYNPAFPETMGGRSHKEPLSLAEEIAEEMSRGHNGEASNEMLLRNESIAHLQKLSMAELIAEARRYEIGIPDEEHAERQEIIFTILKEKIKLNGLLYGEGTLEILPDGFGFLRSKDFNYASCPDDIYVSPSQIRRFGLKTGTIVSGQIRPPKENERYFALLRVEAINFQDPNEFSRKKHFDDLTPTHPTERLRLEADSEEIETRVLDMMVPIGFGQRGLIISPPRAGKTTLLKNIAHAALKNYQDLYVFILLIDERPEEVTDMRKQMKEQNCEVVCSTFDEPMMRHTQVAEMVLEKAKRMVEYGQNVVILLDSITRLARAWNMDTPPGAPPIQGLEPGSLQIPKRFFGSARCVEEGGSLTILATALTETNSAVDDTILEEFQGNGNLEIVLDRRLMEQRVWPAIDLGLSGTRREEMLLTTEEFQAISQLRRLLSELNPVDAMDMLTNRLRKTKTNAEFLAGISGNEAEIVQAVQEVQNAEAAEEVEAAGNAESTGNVESIGSTKSVESAESIDCTKDETDSEADSDVTQD
ncbi:MAG: transcription termination factor Rho [Planctomycetia bacterium]|nr:transcription termination factor Rho [Planctomycetia bacterium]